MPRVIAQVNPTTLLFAEMPEISRFGGSTEYFVILSSDVADGIIKERANVNSKNKEENSAKYELFIVLLSPYSV